MTTTLHAVAELVLAGPQYRLYGDIRLRVTPGGFATTVGPELRVGGRTVRFDDRRCEITGRTPAELADKLGVTARGLEDVYPSGCGVALDDPLDAGRIRRAAYGARRPVLERALRRVTRARGRTRRDRHR